MTPPPTPPPTNAPEAGSNGEREALARVLNQHGFTIDDPDASMLIDAILAAGFTRAHHGGERVGRWEAGFRSIVTIVAGPSAQFDIRDIVERVRAILAERDELAAERDSWRQGYMNVANGGVAALAERDAAIRERDEARAAFDSPHTRHAECAGELYAAEVERDALRSQRDALAAKLDDVLRMPQWVACADRDAAVARAEAAEAKLADINRTIADVDMGEVRAAHAEADAANTRSAALASALRKEIERCPCCRGKGVWETNCPYCGDSTFDHECVTETKICDRCAPARAALAGNGNGTGEG